MSTAAAAATPSDKQNLSPSQLNAVARRCPNLEELILQVPVIKCEKANLIVVSTTVSNVSGLLCRRLPHHRVHVTSDARDAADKLLRVCQHAHAGVVLQDAQ